jgi:hypothetical protein
VSTRRIGILVFDGAEELDWAGPWEVLAAWSKQWPDDGVEVFTVARSDGPITCAKGLRVLADHSPETAPPMELLIVPGGRGARALVGDEPTRAWLRQLRKEGHRQGTPPGLAPPFHRASPRRAPLHPVRPRAAGVAGGRVDGARSVRPAGAGSTVRSRNRCDLAARPGHRR